MAEKSFELSDVFEDLVDWPKRLAGYVKSTVMNLLTDAVRRRQPIVFSQLRRGDSGANIEETLPGNEDDPLTILIKREEEEASEEQADALAGIMQAVAQHCVNGLLEHYRAALPHSHPASPTQDRSRRGRKPGEMRSAWSQASLRVLKDLTNDPDLAKRLAKHPQLTKPVDWAKLILRATGLADCPPYQAFAIVQFWVNGFSDEEIVGILKASPDTWKALGGKKPTTKALQQARTRAWPVLEAFAKKDEICSETLHCYPQFDEWMRDPKKGEQWRLSQRAAKLPATKIEESGDADVTGGSCVG